MLVGGCVAATGLHVNNDLAPTRQLTTDRGAERDSQGANQPPNSSAIQVDNYTQDKTQGKECASYIGDPDEPLEPATQ